jgi:hypothetical protein
LRYEGHDGPGTDGVNYTQLVAAVQDYSENDFNYSADPAVLDNFIKQAETRIYNTVQFPSLRKTSTLSTVLGNPYVDCPLDFLSVYSLAAVLPSGAYEFLLNKDVNFIRSSYPNPASTGTPRYYALFGPTAAAEQELRFIFGPTPSAVFNLELNYFFYPESIVTAGTTWLGDNFDPVLLYASLVEAATYMKQEQDLIALYDNKFKEALVMAKRLGDGLERSDAYRSGQARMPVK